MLTGWRWQGELGETEIASHSKGPSSALECQPPSPRPMVTLADATDGTAVLDANALAESTREWLMTSAWRPAGEGRVGDSARNPV